MEVRRLGLSRVGETTLLTIILDRAAEPRITTSKASGKPQLVVDFPQARAGNLPTRLEGDDILVEQVETQTDPMGVRITLDLFPDQPYSFWRQTRSGLGGQSLFILGLKTDTSGRSLAQVRPSTPTEPAPLPAAPGPPAPSVREPQYQVAPPPAEPPTEEYKQTAPTGNVVSGSFRELLQLMPRAGALLQSLESSGWGVSQSRNYDRAGQRQFRDFTLTNPRYPELAVKIVYMPANSPGAPNIGIVSLTTDRWSSETATKYQNMRQWNFGRIKKEFEDIGDFFEDALKPLRVKLREETKTLALKYAPVFTDFVKAASGSPQVADKVMGHVREKVNPRFEGVQYTVSEKPLIILNQVDFLYVKVYFLDSK
ncbi:MAG: AMIN domain-containing protein [Deltaproteobacteria bacterium]|nr:AMIN domain-containing protein [Deltaproteobacteria bacterium]